jgi:hypothetical protein
VAAVSLSGIPLTAADGHEAIASIAKILLDFSHVPSVSQKRTLQGILDDNANTPAEQVLARALMNIEHVASPDDKPRLEALIRDGAAPPSVRMLATIINNFIHTPTEANKRQLRQLLQRVCDRRN